MGRLPRTVRSAASLVTVALLALVPALTARAVSVAVTAAADAAVTAAAPSCTGDQYLAEYFAATTQTGTPVTSRCEDSIDSDYGTGHPAGVQVGDDRFSVRWTRVGDFTAGRYLFSSTADDGMVVRLDGVTVVDNGGGHTVRTLTTGVDVTAGPHTVVVTYQELTGAALAKMSYALPGLAAPCAAGRYTAQYFANTGYAGTPVVTRCEDAVDEDGDHGRAGPDVPGIGTDGFSVRWTQQRTVAAGSQVLTSTADDGMVVLVDGAVALDNGGAHGPRTVTATRVLTAGVHTIRVSYVQGTGGAVAAFSMVPADQQAPPAPTALVATTGTGSVALSWTASPGATGYRVYRSSTGTPGTGGTPLDPAGLTGTGYADSTATADTTWHYVVTATAGTLQSGPSNQVTATPDGPGVHARIDFAPALAPRVTGYALENGQPFSDATGQGWVRQDSLSGVHVPLSFVATGQHTATSDGNARDRNRSGVDQLLDTVIHAQYGDVAGPTGTAGNPVPGAFEYAVGNGDYRVTVGVGDQPSVAGPACAAPCYDSRHTIRVEGTTAIDRFQGSAAAEYARAAVTVTVTDGRLTVDAIGGTNTKLDFLLIDQVSAADPPPDTTAPAPPTALVATPSDGGVRLGWAPGGEPDLAGYRVYRSTTGAPDVTGTPMDAALLTSPRRTDATVTDGTAYTYAVTAVDTAGNASAGSAPVTATPVATHVDVDFSDAATPPAAGYSQDFGEAYGPRTGSAQGTGSTYGWVAVGTTTPLSLVGNGRNRNTGESAGQPDPRLATLLHMQLASGPGVTTAGSWELAVPDGAYEVTVAVGDAGAAVNSRHWLNVEDQNAVAEFVPTSSRRFATATRSVVVHDGRLTLSPRSGTNTKIDYVTVDSIPGATVRGPAGAGSRPLVTGVPANLATGVSTTNAIVEDLDLPGGPVVTSSLTTGAATITRVSDGVAVPVALDTSGGGDTLNIAPSNALAGGTLYRLTVTTAVRDSADRPFLPYSVVFTTAPANSGGTGTPDPRIAFDRAPSGAPAQFYTAMTTGPDGKMYAATLDGHITRMTIAADGTLSSPQDITTVRDHAVSAGLFGAPDRSIIGMAFDPASTAANPILWVTDNPEFVGVYNVPDFSSHIAKLTGPALGTYTDVIANLPRSVKDHQVNAIAFGPDGALYTSVGANSSMGAPDSIWKFRSEHLLSAAVLRLDTTKLPATLPLDVKTVDAGGPYDPFAPGAPLTVYGSGVRNAYDLVWHSNGHLYAPTNGSGASGATPATPNTLPADCTTHRPDGVPYTGPAVTDIPSNPVPQTDFVYDVKPGRYYGHPNPTRCEWVLDNGNPTPAVDPFQVDAYPVGTLPDRNLDLADTYDAGSHASADGAVEYRGGAFGGALTGKLMVVRYSLGQDIETFDVAADGRLSNRTTGTTGLTGFAQPLALVEDTARGNLYVSETGTNSLTLLRPRASGAPKVAVTGRLVFTDVAGGAASSTRTATVTNAGTAQPTVTGVTVAPDTTDPVNGSHAAQFAVVGSPQLPVVLAPGASLPVAVAFAPVVAGPQGAVLSVTTDDPTTPTAPVTLRGLGARALGGTSEPSLQWVLDTEQVPVASGTTDPAATVMPSTAAPVGDEVSAQSFVAADADMPVTVAAMAVFSSAGPASDPAVVHVRAYDAGTPTTVSQRVLDVPNAGYQTQDPAVTNVTTLDPAGAFGLSFAWPALGHTTYQLDGQNTWEPNPVARHKVRVYPFRTAAGAPVPGAYVVAPEDVSAPGIDFQDAVLVVRNVRPAAVSPAVLTVAALDGIPSTDRAVFNRIQSPRVDGLPNDPQLVHDTSTVRVSDNGTAPMVISALTVTGPWALPDAPALPATVAAGAHLDLRVVFTATGGDSRSGSLVVAGDSGSRTVALAGFWQSVSEGNQEPTVHEVVGLLGWGTVVPTDLNQHGKVVAVGDEVLSRFWKRADSAVPLRVTQLTAFHNWPNAATFSLRSTSGSTLASAGVNGDSAQSLLPWATGSRTRIAGGSFSPSATTFALGVDGESSDDTRNDATTDHAHGCSDPCGHHVRFFPVENAAGTVLPGQWLMVTDYGGGANDDYNDNDYLVTNLAPVT